VIRRLPLLLGLAFAAAAAAQPAASSRGQLLYGNHCIACHSTQVHWRDQRLARDWPSLRAQVQRWQAAAYLNWGEEDIDDVAAHLNDTIYRFPRPGRAVGGAPPVPVTPG